MPSLIPDAAAFEKRLAGLPVVKHPAHQVVLTAGSKTGRLLFLRSGAVEVIKDNFSPNQSMILADGRLTVGLIGPPTNERVNINITNNILRP